ncbi:MAG: diguanylate cyclase [Betaproteobacteria bacterium AqS2]|uniref:diguanylate cyclase n=1 Tax=Candidatus Amphirhobacter heronislandensis TaxID=1732024 RepID=A0A930UG71_9GAMM|nr:diguanylate cyclase [Betaproteobacteria bacterium AqS2]
MFSIETLGAEVLKAFEAASQGHFADTFTLIERRDGVSDWRITCVPAPGGRVLLLLTSRATDIAFFDPLTKLPNRRSAMERLEREWERWQRSRRESFGIALADIDHFKNVNDTYGHDTGDQVLQMVSDAFASSLRSGDWVARWGGEEFLLLFHDADRAGVLAGSERCRTEVEREPWRSPAGLSIDVTVSLGAVTVDESYAGDDSAAALEAMLANADQLLYDAKHEGRNRCIVQGAGERLAWSGAEIDAALAAGDLRAAASPIVDERGAPAGQFWRPKIKDLADRGASHFFQSALRENRVDKAEAKLLELVREGVVKYPAAGGIAVVSCNSSVLRRIGDCPGFRQAIADLAATGVQVMLAAKNLAEPGRVQRELEKVADGVELCPWYDGNSLEAFSLAEQYDHIMLEHLSDAKPKAIDNFLRLLKDTSCQLIVSEAKKEGTKLPHPNTLYHYQ